VTKFSNRIVTDKVQEGTLYCKD